MAATRERPALRAPAEREGKQVSEVKERQEKEGWWTREPRAGPLRLARRVKAHGLRRFLTQTLLDGINVQTHPSDHCPLRAHLH